jgi:hypothetical protein
MDGSINGGRIVLKVGDVDECANYDQQRIRALLAMPWAIAVIKQCMKSADGLVWWKRRADKEFWGRRGLVERWRGKSDGKEVVVDLAAGERALSDS